MELSLPRADLSRLLARAASVAAVKSPISSLCAVHLDAATARLTARATDGYLAVQASVDAKVKKPGTAAADARRIAEIVKSLPAGDVTLKLSGAQLELRAGKAKFKVAVIEAADFPSLPRLEDATQVARVPAADLLRCLAQGAYALNPSDARPEQNVAFLDASDGFLRVASLDGLRLAVAQLECECAPAQISVPAKGVGELKKLCDAHKGGDVGIAYTDRHVFFAAGDVVLTVVKQESPFPPYRKFLPTAHEQSVILHKETFVDVLRRVALVATEKDGCGVRLAFSAGELRVSASDAVGEGEDSVATDGAFDLEMRVNPVFLAEAASAVADEEARLEMTGEFGPMVVSSASSDECKGLCLPLKK